MNKLSISMFFLSLFFTLFFSACNYNDSEFIPNKLIDESNIQLFKESSIILENGSEVFLPENISENFKETEDIRSKASDVNSTDVIKTYLDRVVIERSTVVEIDSDEEYEEVFGNETPDYDVTNSTEGIDNEAVITGFEDSCRTDRSKPFCDLSIDDVEKMLENKSGSYEVIETVSVRQIPLENLNLVVNGLPDLFNDPLDEMVPNINFENKTSGPMPLQGMQYAGPSYQQEIFIDGFTYGFELGYEKKFTWSKFGKTVADARLFSYVGYGLGLRIPFKAELTIHNSVIDSSDENFVAKIDLEPLDLDASGYRDAGLSEAHLFDGKELVLKFGAEAGAKIKLLGNTVFDSSFGKLIDNSKDFVPPVDGEMVNLGRLVFEGTDTGLYYGDGDLFVDGDIGVTFNLKGEHFTFDCAGFNTDCSKIEVERSKVLNLSLDPIIHDEEDDFGKFGYFGISLFNPRYSSKANFGAEFSIEAGVNVPYLGWRSVRTPWVELYNFDVDLPYLTRHSGTSNRLASVNNKAYMNIPIFDNETLNLLGGPLALNVTNRCQRLQDIVSEGEEVDMGDELINIYTGFGDAIGSITINNGIVSDIDCYHIHSDPTYELEFEDYGVLNEFNNNNVYDDSINLIDQDRIKIKGVGFKNKVTSFVGNNFVGLIN